MKYSVICIIFLSYSVAAQNEKFSNFQPPQPLPTDPSNSTDNPTTTPTTKPTTPTTTTTATTPTTTTASTTASTTQPTTSPTTTKPTTKGTTSEPTTTITTTTTTTTASTTIHPTSTMKPNPDPPSDRRFDAPSFIGGFVLALGLVAIAFVSWKFYVSRQENYYHTL